MSFLQVNSYAESLARQNTFNVILPDDLQPMMKAGNPHFERETKTLFLLHGYSGNMHDWLTGSNVQELAIKYNLAVVMPNGGNHFYLNGKGTGNKSADYVGTELVEYMRRTFGLAKERENTFIGGLSMGGFGALHTGLQFHENFGKIIALSSALIIHQIQGMRPGAQNEMADYDYYVSVFGDLAQLEGSEKDPEYLMQQLKAQGREIPEIYMACGTEDFLLENNRQMHEFLVKEHIPVSYQEGPGAHEWGFWNRYLEPAVCWMLQCEPWVPMLP